MAESKTIPIEKYHTSFHNWNFNANHLGRCGAEQTVLCVGIKSSSLCALRRLNGRWRIQSLASNHFRWAAYRWAITIELCPLFNSLEWQNAVARAFIIDMVSVSKANHPSIVPTIAHQFGLCVLCMHNLAAIHLIWLVCGWKWLFIGHSSLAPQSWNWGWS